MSKFATHPRDSAESTGLVRMLKGIRPMFRAKPSPSATPVAHRKQVHLVNGIITVTQEQAIADTKALMEFYHANAVRDMEWQRCRAGVADFTNLQ